MRQLKPLLRRKRVSFLVQDADLEYDPNDYQNFLNTLDENFSVVCGSRNLGHNLLFGSKLTDINTGYKFFSNRCH